MKTESNLSFFSGEKAKKIIRNKGFNPSLFTHIFAASGAAKWLTIYGLDKAIFKDFLSCRNHSPISLFGTSIGAFKLSAAAQDNPDKALTQLAHRYIEQAYPDGINRHTIDRETKKIIDGIITPESINEILTNPRYFLHFASTRCHGPLTNESLSIQKRVLTKLFFRSTFGRKYQTRYFSRAVFHDPRAINQIPGNDLFDTEQIPLTPNNFKQAITSSGSIPVHMSGITNLSTQGDGTYRDGGLIDYHPIPNNLLTDTEQRSEALILYPHFYNQLTEGWFDKFFPWRKVPLPLLDNIILIYPSQAFIKKLPNGRIPSRQDFIRYQGNDKKRKAMWYEVIDRSEQLGEEFLQLVESGKIVNRILNS